MAGNPGPRILPGDTVHIRLGDIVPADCLLGSGKYLLVDESALTGESLPIEKKPGDTVYPDRSHARARWMQRSRRSEETPTLARRHRLVQVKSPRSHFQADCRADRELSHHLCYRDGQHRPDCCIPKVGIFSEYPSVCPHPCRSGNSRSTSCGIDGDACRWSRGPCEKGRDCCSRLTAIEEIGRDGYSLCR